MQWMTPPLVRAIVEKHGGWPVFAFKNEVPVRRMQALYLPLAQEADGSVGNLVKVDINNQATSLPSRRRCECCEQVLQSSSSCGQLDSWIQMINDILCLHQASLRSEPFSPNLSFLLLPDCLLLGGGVG
jgi:hypothetical protein